jgi:hypothetical protein
MGPYLFSQNFPDTTGPLTSAIECAGARGDPGSSAFSPQAQGGGRQASHWYTEFLAGCAPEARATRENGTDRSRLRFGAKKESTKCRSVRVCTWFLLSSPFWLAMAPLLIGVASLAQQGELPRPETEFERS